MELKDEFIIEKIAPDTVEESGRVHSVWLTMRKEEIILNGESGVFEHKQKMENELPSYLGKKVLSEAHLIDFEKRKIGLEGKKQIKQLDSRYYEIEGEVIEIIKETVIQDNEELDISKLLMDCDFKYLISQSNKNPCNVGDYVWTKGYLLFSKIELIDK
ncbi:MAG: hypothetical protein KAS32_06320 [Candidatus Peribacteraceae bacterium]|nr:hypothetical protein [Candidatus Peribacteraceae bacterium]